MKLLPEKTLNRLSAAISLALLVISFLLLSLQPGGALAGTAQFTVGETLYSVNDTLRLMDVAPYIRDGRAYLPARYVAYSLGVPEGGVLWNGVRRTVTLIKGSKTVQVKIGSNTLLAGEKLIRMDVAPEIINGRAMLPVRYIAQALGARVDWDPASRRVTLTVSEAGDPIWPAAGSPPGDFEITYQWEYQDSIYQWEIPVPKEQFDQLLEYYRQKPHPPLNLLDPGEYINTYAGDPDDDAAIADIVQELEKIAEQEGFSEYEKAEFVLSFVQGMPYVEDSESTSYDEYPRYPLETLLEKCGDCEDTAILAGVLLREMGYGTALLIIEGDPGHAALGILGWEDLSGSYYQLADKKFFYVETTATGWPIGLIPPRYRNAPATVITFP